MHRSKKFKIAMIITLLIIELCFVSLTIKSFCNKNLKEIKLEHKVDKKKFSMYVQNDTGGYDEYTESNLFPEGYNLNLEKSSCVDTNGNVLNGVLTITGANITISSNKTTYCYLYFDLLENIEIDVSTDGESGLMPVGGTYTNSATCNSGSITWSNKYQRIEIGDLTKPTKCNVTFTKDTGIKTLLRDEVETNAETNTYGYRYSGMNPDNYMWFNNEMWRIIGSIPTCLTASCGSNTTNLVKIIRNDSIGILAFDGTTSGYTGAWGSNTLYNLLNSYFYGANGTTGNSWCSSYGGTIYGKCLYQNVGIKSTSYYGKMLKKVYWNTGKSDCNIYPSESYSNEIATRTISNYIGLMTASDYAYAGSNNWHNQSMSSIASGSRYNWLFSQSSEWTSIQYKSNTTQALMIDYDGSMNKYVTRNGKSVRPVVYLDESVYVISGTGTESDPYIIGM